MADFPFLIPCPFFYTIPVDVRRAFLVSLIFSLAFIRPAAAVTRTLVCFGDSITAGLGLLQGQAYPDFLERDLTAAGYRYKVLNRGTSGATTGDAVASLPGILALHPSVVIVEFGGNDGLRGLPLDTTRRNLDQVLTALEAAHIKVLLAGITLPPNYGPDYIQSFQQVFRTLAAHHRVAFVPMIYKNLIHVHGTIQPDGIHPTAKGSAILADTLLPALKPLLHREQ
ncbi:MAG TPA: arylesterase [Terracidiphilus sp.]|nr:arylesterase [Terracidiphilus sp.]